VATTNHNLARIIQTLEPHTFNAMQHLVMAMADYSNNRHKRTFFGRDRGLAALKKFESALRDTLLAMVIDGKLARDAAPEDCVHKLALSLARWAEAFPNWQDAYTFAEEYFGDGFEAAVVRVNQLMRQI
jgi:hypothetical protein